MTKIEEIQQTVAKDFERYTLLNNDSYPIKQMMIQYAEWYAQKCLEIAAENVELYEEGYYNRNDDPDYRWVVNKESITKIQLPEHE